MNEARDNLKEAASLDPETWAAWAEPTPGLYAYDPETNEPRRLTDLGQSEGQLLALRG